MSVDQTRRTASEFKVVLIHNTVINEMIFNEVCYILP